MADRLRALGPLLFLLAGLLAAGCGGPAATAPVAPVGSVSGGPQPLPPLPDVRPVGLSVPSIGVAETELVELGRLPGGELEVPVDFARAGWFSGGAVPGAPGPAVIAGHVDSRDGPAVFHRLRELRPGDPIEVVLSDGGVAAFVVDDVAQYRRTPSRPRPSTDRCRAARCG